MTHTARLELDGELLFTIRCEAVTQNREIITLEDKRQIVVRTVKFFYTVQEG